MPIKRKILTNNIPVNAAPTVKKVAKRAPPPKIKEEKKAKTTSPKRPEKVHVELGPPLDPSTLEGANEHAESLLGKTLGFTAKFSTGGTSSFSFHFNGKPKDKSKAKWWWRQCGAAVVFESEPLEARYKGRIAGDTCSGTAMNDINATWTWQGQFSATTGVYELYLRD
jgi:hypothetical protein